MNVFPDFKKGTHGTPYLKIQPSCTEVLSLILYISIRLKNKKETYSHTATKLLLRRAINLKKGVFMSVNLSITFMASRRDDDVTTASIERFHSSDQHLCKFMGTKESVYIRKESNSHRICLKHQHGRRFTVLENQNGRHDVM